MISRDEGMDIIEAIPTLLIHRDAFNVQSPDLILVRDFDKAWRFGLAGRAPGRPKVQQYDTAPVLRECPGPSIQSLEREVGHRFPLADRQRGRERSGVRVADADKQRQSEQSQRDCCQLVFDRPLWGRTFGFRFFLSCYNFGTSMEASRRKRQKC